MPILTIQKAFEGFKRKFEPLSNPNSNHSKGIQRIQMQIRTIRSIPMQIPTIRKSFEAFERKFEPFERDSKH